MNDDELDQAEQLCRRIGPANSWTGTGGTLAAISLRMIRQLRSNDDMDRSVDGGTVTFASGAVRSSDAEATRYDLISPIGLRAVARAAAEGSRKYSDYNWERGMPVADLLNHALRHIYEFLAGDRSDDHLGHAAWNLLGAVHSAELWPDLNRGTLRGEGCRPPQD